MKRVMMMVAGLVLAGCETAALAPQELTNVQLCDAFFHAPEPYATQAGQEATSRGVRCPEYRDAVAHYRQSRQAAAAEAWLASRPRPSPTPIYQPRTSVHCTTTTAGGMASTTCR